MVFAFNCVTVILLYIEMARYFLRDDVPLIKGVFDRFFKSFCDEREKDPNAFIITHILLLMGYLHLSILQICLLDALSLEPLSSL